MKIPIIIGRLRGVGAEALALAVASIVISWTQPTFAGWADANPAVKPLIVDFSWPNDPGDVLCGHVALANALWYCHLTTCPNVIPQNLLSLGVGTVPGWNEIGTYPFDLYPELTKLGSLTTCAGMRSGIETWFQNNGGGLRLEEECWWSPSKVKPTWDFYEQELRACEVPIIGIEWEGGGGHWLTGVGWYDDDFLVHDPNFGPYTQKEDRYDWSDPGDGFMHITYDGHDATITCVFAVSQVPEPSAYVLVLLGLVLLSGHRRRPDRG